MDHKQNRPPLFSSWRMWYLLVIGFLMAMILLFYWLTKTFS